MFGLDELDETLGDMDLTSRSWKVADSSAALSPFLEERKNRGMAFVPAVSVSLSLSLEPGSLTFSKPRVESMR